MRRSDSEAIEAAIATDPEEAIALVGELMEEDGGDADLWALLAEAQEAAGMSEEALSTWSQYLELDPDWPEAYTRRAEILIDLGRHQAADAELRVAGELFAEDGRVIWHRGLWHEIGGDDAAAMAHYRQAADLDPLLSVPARFPRKAAENHLRGVLREQGLKLELAEIPDSPGEEGMLRALDLPGGDRCVVYLRNLERELDDVAGLSDLGDLLVEALDGGRA